MARLFEALTLKLNEPLEIRCDNSQTIGLLTEKSAKLKTKLRHVDVPQSLITARNHEQNINLLWESSQRTLADGLTKPLSPAKFAEFVALLRLDDLLDRLEMLERADAIHTRILSKLAIVESGQKTEAFSWSKPQKQSSVPF
jgi:hypothetical protein